MLRKRKASLAEMMGIEFYAEFKVVFGASWWHHLGAALLDVVTPQAYYQIQENGVLVWDELGFKAYCADIAKFPADSIEDAMLRSWYRLFWEVGVCMFRGDEGQVRNFALHKMGKRPSAVLPIDPQLSLQFPTDPHEDEEVES
jgi:hypothetical protein